MANLSVNEQEFLSKSLKGGLRLDGRGLLDHRNLSISFGFNLGSVELSLGNTKIQSKVTATLEEPKKERPQEGFLKFKVDLSVLDYDKQANSVYHKEKYSNEISKLLENIIKGSKALDVESLSVLTGKCAWSILVELTLVNNDGNLIDTFYLAAIVALLHFKKPFVSIESDKEVVVHDEKDKLLQALSIPHIPIAFTFAFFNDSTTVIMDPTRLEEEVMDGRITFALNIYKDICSIHKPGGAPLSQATFAQLLDVCNIKVAQITKIIREVLKDQEKYSIEGLKEKTKIDMVSNVLEKDGNSYLAKLAQAGAIEEEDGDVKTGIMEEELEQTLAGGNN